MPRLLILCVLSLTVIHASCVSANSLCRRWKQPKRLAELDPETLKEASGLAVSFVEKDTLYHINDSGDGPYIYRSDAYGREIRRIAIANFDPKDTEDIAYGRCEVTVPSAHERCVIVADIGDNEFKRKSVQFAVIAEADLLQASVTAPSRIFRAKYPGGPRNAESVALHPITGDLFVLSKPDLDRSTGLPVGPAELFRLKARHWRSPADEALKFEKLEELSLEKLQPEVFGVGGVPTSMDFSKDGTRLLVLSYAAAIEIVVDPKQPNFKETEAMRAGRDYRTIAVPQQPQQEAVAYLAGENDFLISSEYRNEPGALIMMSCRIRVGSD